MHENVSDVSHSREYQNTRSTMVRLVVVGGGYAQLERIEANADPRAKREYSRELDRVSVLELCERSNEFVCASMGVLEHLANLQTKCAFCWSWSWAHTHKRKKEEEIGHLFPKFSVPAQRGGQACVGYCRTLSLDARAA